MSLAHHISYGGDAITVPVLDNYEDTEDAAGGCMSASGSIALDALRAGHQGDTPGWAYRNEVKQRRRSLLDICQQGATFRTFIRETGEVVWGGELLDPGFDGERMLLVARGWGTLPDRYIDRLLFASRAAGDWAGIAGDPYNYNPTGNGESMQTDSTHGAIRIKVPEGDPHSDGDRNGLVFWAQGNPIRRIAFTIRKNRDTSEFELRLYGANGPGGSRTLLKTWALTSANPTGTAIDESPAFAGTDFDQVSLELAVVAGFGDLAIAPALARTATATSAWTALPGAGSGAGRGPVAAKCTLTWTAHSGTGETLAVEILSSADAGTSNHNVGHMDQKAHGAAASGSEASTAQGLASSIAAKWTIAGTTPSWTFNVTAQLGYSAFALTMQSVRVNSIAANSNDFDVFSVSDVALDICSRLGIRDDLVEGNAQNVLPLDIKQGTHAEPLDYVCALTGWRWLVLDTGHGPVMDLGPWDKRTWLVTDRATPATFQGLERFDRVLVPFHYPHSGAAGMKEVVAESKDRLPRENAFSGISLQGELPDDSVAEAIGKVVVDYLVQKRWGGDSDIGTFVYASDKPHHRRYPHNIHAGDTLRYTHHGISVRAATLRRTAAGVSVTFDDSIRPLDRLLERRSRRLALAGD